MPVAQMEALAEDVTEPRLDDMEVMVEDLEVVVVEELLKPRTTKS